MATINSDLTKRIIATEKENMTPEALARLAKKIDIASGGDAPSSTSPKIEKQSVVLVSDPTGKLGDLDLDAWLVTIILGEKPASVRERIQAAAENYNATRKGQVLPAKTVAEAFAGVPPKFFKDRQLWVLTKEPIPLVTTDNKITGLPDEPGS